jgi:hypothetical protein
MLSLNLPQIFCSTPRAVTAGRGGRIKACPAQTGGLKSGATMPKSPLRRNVAEDENRRFLKGITDNRARHIGARGAAGA